MTQIFGNHGPLRAENLTSIIKQPEARIAPQRSAVFSGNSGPASTLEQCTNSSILGNTKLTQSTLKAKGFEKSPIMDMNGGEYYNNPITGEQVRVSGSWNNSGKTCYEYQKGNMQHSVVYDKNGKALSGDVQIRQKDGTLQIIKYDIDTNGNKIITSVETKKCTMIDLSITTMNIKICKLEFPNYKKEPTFWSVLFVFVK